MSIQAIITVVSDGCSLKDVRAFADQVKRLAVPFNTELLDGANAFIDGGVSIMDSYGRTFKDLTTWLSSYAELDGCTRVNFGEFLSIDAHIVDVEEINCGEHIYPDSAVGVVVTTNASCQGH